MDYNTLLDLAADLGYKLAMCGAETFRVEDSINRLLATYGIQSEVFAIPNCLTVSIETAEGKPMTRMRRIGHHGNDLDAVEKYNSLCRRICAEKPDAKDAVQWLAETDASRITYKQIGLLSAHFLGSAGFCVLFGGNLIDAVCAGLCGILIGLLNHFLNNLKVNPFFCTITSAFGMAFFAYAMGAVNLANNTDTVVIGALMLLVPGLLFTNAMRDIIFGDTNSGTNRIVQVLLVAAAIALGTGAAWNLFDSLCGVLPSPPPANHSFDIQLIASFVGCLGFAIYFNIHGPGALLCALGGTLSWAVYLCILAFSGNDILAYFVAAITSAAYSEAMARIRKYPAISYLVVSIFPLIPGASIYYTTYDVVRGNMEGFAAQGTHTIAIAGAIAVGILIVSTVVRLHTVWRHRKKKSQ